LKLERGVSGFGEPLKPPTQCRPTTQPQITPTPRRDLKPVHLCALDVSAVPERERCPSETVRPTTQAVVL